MSGGSRRRGQRATLLAAGVQRANWVIAVTGNEWSTRRSSARCAASPALAMRATSARARPDRGSSAGRFFAEERDSGPADPGAAGTPPAAGRPVVTPFSTNAIAAEALLDESRCPLSGRAVPLVRCATAPPRTSCSRATTPARLARPRGGPPLARARSARAGSRAAGAGVRRCTSASTGPARSDARPGCGALAARGRGVDARGPRQPTARGAATGGGMAPPVRPRRSCHRRRHGELDGIALTLALGGRSVTALG